MQQEIVNQKTALQTTDTAGQANVNSVYFGPQTDQDQSSDPSNRRIQFDFYTVFELSAGMWQTAGEDA